jgi:hypothetical protein
MANFGDSAESKSRNHDFRHWFAGKSSCDSWGNDTSEIACLASSGRAPRLVMIGAYTFIRSRPQPPPSAPEWVFAPRRRSPTPCATPQARNLCLGVAMAEVALTLTARDDGRGVTAVSPERPAWDARAPGRRWADIWRSTRGPVPGSPSGPLYPFRRDWPEPARQCAAQGWPGGSFG